MPDIPDFGDDFAGVGDVDVDAVVAGPRALGEALARRLRTPRGSLWYDPAYGEDVRDAVGEALDAADVFALTARARAECERDERVRAADVTVAFDPPAGALTLVVVVQTADGPFKYVLGVTEVTVTLLSVE